MIRVTTKFDFSESKWRIVGKPMLNSRYNSWRRDMFSVDTNYCHSHNAQTHGSPVLGPTCLTVWSK